MNPSKCLCPFHVFHEFHCIIVSCKKLSDLCEGFSQQQILESPLKTVPLQPSVCAWTKLLQQTPENQL